MPAAKWTADATLDALLQALDEGAVVFDQALRCRAVGRRVGELFGFDPAIAFGVDRAALFHRFAAASDAPDAILALAGAAAETVVAEVQLSRPEPRSIVWTSVPVLRSGAVLGRIDVLRDVTRERTTEVALGEMARKLDEVCTIDALSGLPNRRRFEQESDREHRRAQRAWDSYAVARIDVDTMSKVNERHGRAAGDGLLRRLGEELRASRREYDVVARWDGDEFIVLLPGADAVAARTVMKRALGAMLAAAVDVTGAKDITLSAGAAVWIPPSAEVAEDIIRRAGSALDAARSRGPASIEIDAGASRWKDETSEG